MPGSLAPAVPGSFLVDYDDARKAFAADDAAREKYRRARET
jgi:hypothetical protein